MEEMIKGAFGWASVAVVVTMAALALIIVFKVALGQIAISDMLTVDGKSSLSRFQFLIFTFVVGFAYLLIVFVELINRIGCATNCGVLALPDASGSAWLLGISAGGYVLGKGIQTAGDTAQAQAQAGGTTNTTTVATSSTSTS